MLETINNFNTKTKETELYFRLLKMMEDPNYKIQNKKSKRSQKLHPDTHKILKATALLMLYNLIESTIRSCILEIYNSIKAESLSYKQVSQNIRKIWIKLYSRALLKRVGDEKITQYLTEVAETIIKDSVIDLIPKDINDASDFKAMQISGNIDAKKIIDLANNHGFSYKTVKQAKGGSCLLTIKNRRNQLGHGIESFATTGSDFSMNDLIKIKTETIIYMRGILNNVKKYIQKKQYKN